MKKVRSVWSLPLSGLGAKFFEVYSSLIVVCSVRMREVKSKVHIFMLEEDCETACTIGTKIDEYVARFWSKPTRSIHSGNRLER